MFHEVEKGKRIKIITGHFGSGKTEFSINYSLYLKKFFENVAIVDLDIINMYFRIREKMDFLESQQLEVFSSKIPKSNTLDIPAVDPAILKPLENDSYMAVLDVGGNPKGSLSLGRYRDLLAEKGYDHYFVINRNRPETQTVEQIKDFINQVQSHSQTKITGLINTTHMLKDTRVEDILYGDELVREVSSHLQLPVIYTVCISSIAHEVREKGVAGEVFPIELYFRDEWML